MATTDKRMSVTLNERRYFALKRAADLAGVTMADMINDAIDQYLLIMGRDINRKHGEHDSRADTEELGSYLASINRELSAIKEMLIRMEKQ